MDDNLNIIEIGPTRRVTISADEFAYDDCPLDWEDEIFVHILREPYLSRSTLSRDTVPWTVPVRDIEDHAEDAEDVGAALVKHFQRRGWRASVASWTGYSQGDWREYIIAAPDNYLPALVETLNQWLSGDVYVLSAEELITWRNDAGDTRETWEMVESVSGIYSELWDDGEILSEVSNFMGNDWMEGN